MKALKEARVHINFFGVKNIFTNLFFGKNVQCKKVGSRV